MRQETLLDNYLRIHSWIDPYNIALTIKFITYFICTYAEELHLLSLITHKDTLFIPKKLTNERTRYISALFWKPQQEVLHRQQPCGESVFQSEKIFLAYHSVDDSFCNQMSLSNCCLLHYVTVWDIIFTNLVPLHVLRSIRHIILCGSILWLVHGSPLLATARSASNVATPLTLDNVQQVRVTTACGNLVYSNLRMRMHQRVTMTCS